MRITNRVHSRRSSSAAGSRLRGWARKMVLYGLLPFLAMPALAEGFVDPLDLPAGLVLQLEQQPLRDIVQADDRLITVGDAGLIIYSDDLGSSWLQAEVPVSADINSVHFSGPKLGWAVGHGASILHSSDGGETWHKQLDGRVLEQMYIDYFEQETELEKERAADYLDAILYMTRPGPGQFFMDVWFDEQGLNGYAVGPFGLMLGSRDGGHSWQPWNTRIDNNDLLHLTSIREANGGLFISGERGHVWRLDSNTQRFVAGDVGYEGTLFGLVGGDGLLLAHGLRGNIFRSADDGLSWAAVDSDFSASITGGAALGERNFVLISQSAQVAVSHDGGASFSQLDIARPTLFTGVLGVASDQLLLVGLNGVTLVSTK